MSCIPLFESFVNSEECKTTMKITKEIVAFESFVNSEECKTKMNIRYMCR